MLLGRVFLVGGAFEYCFQEGFQGVFKDGSGVRCLKRFVQVFWEGV